MDLLPSPTEEASFEMVRSKADINLDILVVQYKIRHFCVGYLEHHGDIRKKMEYDIAAQKFVSAALKKSGLVRTCNKWKDLERLTASAESVQQADWSALVEDFREGTGQQFVLPGEYCRRKFLDIYVKTVMIQTDSELNHWLVELLNALKRRQGDFEKLHGGGQDSLSLWPELISNHEGYDAVVKEILEKFYSIWLELQRMISGEEKCHKMNLEGLDSMLGFFTAIQQSMIKLESLL